jgi:ubiquitin carboxyl-terminal hydrolase 5/13
MFFRAERASNITSLDSIGSLPKLLTFSIEERYECDVSHQVKYVQVENENTLTLAIPIEKALNLAEVNEYNERVNAMQDSGISKQDIAKVAAPKPVVPFSACIEEFIKPEKLDSFYSTATKSRGPAAKTTRLASFPPYLFVKMKRYVLSSDWTPKKLDASVSVPESFDFSVLRGYWTCLR